MSTLLLYSPKDTPYGNLSPLADNIVSKSYASLIKSKLLCEKVGKMRSDEAVKEALKIFKEVQDERFKTFLKEALKVKYKEGSPALDSLLKIREDRIIYDSENHLLGMSDGVGENFIGECLYAIRKNERAHLVLKQKQERQDYINKVYSVYTLFRDEIQSGKNNLKSYTNKNNIDEIIEQRILENLPVTIVNTTLKNAIPDFLFNFPESIPAILQCLYHTNYNEKCNTIKKEELLAFYINQLSIKCKFKKPEMKQQLLAKLEANGQIDSLLARLQKYKELDLFPTFTYSCSPLREADLNIDLFEIYKEELRKEKAAIENYQPYQLYTPPYVMTPKSIQSDTESGKPKKLLELFMMPDKVTKPYTAYREPTVFYFNDTSIHSPYHYVPNVDLLYIIGTFSYPSIMHYVYSKMYEFFGILKNKYTARDGPKFVKEEKIVKKYEYVTYNQFEAYSLIQREMPQQRFVFLDFSELKDRYHELKDDYIKINVQKTFEELTRIKYAPTYTKEGEVGVPSKNVILLISTLKDYSDISFTDREETILGQGYASAVLMTIRQELDEFYKKHGDIDFKKLEKDKVKKLKNTADILKDEDIRLFSIKKVKELYQMMKQFKSKYFMTNLDGKQIPYSDIEAFNFIFLNFLDCIIKIVKFDKFDKSLVPDDFSTEMEFNASKECMEELWKYTFFIYQSTLQIAKSLGENGKERVFGIIDRKQKQSALNALKRVKLSMVDSFDGLKILEKINETTEETEYKKPILPGFVKEKKEEGDKEGDKEAKEDAKEDIKEETKKKTQKSSKSRKFKTSILAYKLDDFDFSLFQTNDESQYSSLLPKHVKKVKDIMKGWFTDPRYIVDATAHIGVDTIHFAKMFPMATIDSFEINKETFDLLEKNVDAFDLSSKITLHQSSFLKANLDQKSSFIYIDAPWGGKEYSEFDIDTYELYLDTINVKEIARRLIVSGKTDTVVLKVPRNYKFNDLKNIYGFNVSRKDVKEGDWISYVLLKLTLPEQEIQKCFIRSLCISAFLTIFDTLAKFIPDFKFDENALKFAVRLVYVSDEFIHPDENKQHSISTFYFQELLNPYFIKDESSDSYESQTESPLYMEMEEKEKEIERKREIERETDIEKKRELERKIEKQIKKERKMEKKRKIERENERKRQIVIKSVIVSQNIQKFGKIFEQCVDAIVNSIYSYSFTEVVTRIILFTKSNKITMASIQKYIKEQIEEEIKSLDEVLLVDEYEGEDDGEGEDKDENDDGNYGGEDDETESDRDGDKDGDKDSENWGDDNYDWEDEE